MLAGDQPVLVHNVNSACPVHGGPTDIPNRDLREPQQCTCTSGGGPGNNGGSGFDEGAPETANRRVTFADELRAQQTTRDSIGRGIKGEVDAIKNHTDPIGGGVILVLGIWAKIKSARGR